MTDKVHVGIHPTTELITATNYQLHAIYSLLMTSLVMLSVAKPTSLE
jgi:hypothetical protein